MGHIDDQEQAKLLLTAWERIVEVQMHFNDLGLRIRNLYITVMLGLIVSIGWLLEKGYKLDLIYDVKLGYSTFAILMGMVIVELFRLKDLYWYHQLLRGSVLEGGQIEAALRELGIGVQLGTSITEASHAPLHKAKVGILVYKMLFLYSGNKDTPHSMKSEHRLRVFYGLPMRVLQFGLISLILFGGIEIHQRSLANNILSALASALSC